MANWSSLILDTAEMLGETVELSLPSLLDESMEREFNNGYGDIEGCAFVAFTESWVLFPLQYDGKEWVGRAPRNPEAAYTLRHQGCPVCEHQGGG